jgi:hypothetical protein
MGGNESKAPARPGRDPHPQPPIEDEPGFHGFFMVGMQTLYPSHMPMFTEERHMYQVILRATLQPEIMDEYRAGRKSRSVIRLRTRYQSPSTR